MWRNGKKCQKVFNIFYKQWLDQDFWTEYNFCSVFIMELLNGQCIQNTSGKESLMSKMDKNVKMKRSWPIFLSLLFLESKIAFFCESRSVLKGLLFERRPFSNEGPYQRRPSAFEKQVRFCFRLDLAFEGKK